MTKYGRIKLSKGALQVPVAQQTAEGFKFTVRVTQFNNLPLWKALLCLHSGAAVQEHCSILRVCFSLSKYPHFHSMYPLVLVTDVTHLMSRRVPELKIAQLPMEECH